MNSLFQFATKELSQDAFLCWSINWLSQDKNAPLYQYGKTMLDLFLGNKKQEYYRDVKVRTQYKKIDVLVLFIGTDNKRHALIIEDKTNTSEHSNQLQRYKENIQREEPTAEVHLAYIKTGIMYDEDVCMMEKGAKVVDLNSLLSVVSQYAKLGVSEILKDFNEYIQSIKNHRVKIETEIEAGHYESALQDYYGQFYFLDRIFCKRSKGISIGDCYVEHKLNYPILVDNVYAGTNNGGTPWCQYCFWGEKYPHNHVDANKNEYHYLFWRIDCQTGYYLALRHYDSLAHSKDEYLNERKRIVYRKFREKADEEYEKRKNLYQKIGTRENYKESDLLFIPIERIEGKPFDEIKELLIDITQTFSKSWENLYDGMSEALEGK